MFLDHPLRALALNQKLESNVPSTISATIIHTAASLHIIPSPASCCPTLLGSDYPHINGDDHPQLLLQFQPQSHDFVSLADLIIGASPQSTLDANYMQTLGALEAGAIQWELWAMVTLVRHVRDLAEPTACTSSPCAGVPSSLRKSRKSNSRCQSPSAQAQCGCQSRSPADLAIKRMR